MTEWKIEYVMRSINWMVRNDISGVSVQASESAKKAVALAKKEAEADIGESELFNYVFELEEVTKL